MVTVGQLPESMSTNTLVKEHRFIYGSWKALLLALCLWLLSQIDIVCFYPRHTDCVGEYRNAVHLCVHPSMCVCSQ